MRTCVSCKAEFEIEKKRGRPHTRCEKCRSASTAPKTGKSVSTQKPASIVEAPITPDVGGVKAVKRFKDSPTKGNERYSRAAFIAYMEEHGTPIGSQAVAEAIRLVRNGEHES